MSDFTIRDFSGGWNAVDSDLNLSSKFSKRLITYRWLLIAYNSSLITAYRLPGYPVTRLPVTRLLGYPVTRLPVTGYQH